MHYEVEQKFPIDDLSRLEQALAELGARTESPQVQRDTYFDHPTRNFAQTDEALRIRQVGDSNCITYKGPKVDAETKTRQELEVPLPPGQRTADQYAELFATLGFVRVAQVRKSRRELRIDWQGQSVQGALDDVDGLGTFVELEISVDAEKVEDAKAVIGQLAKKLGLRYSERRSYLELLLAE